MPLIPFGLFLKTHVLDCPLYNGAKKCVWVFSRKWALMGSD